MQIDNIIITCISDEDGFPIKNHLPEKLRIRLKTENQWLEAGFAVKPGAIGYEMHPSVVYKKLRTYYIDTNVEQMSENNAPHNCMGCKIRNGRYCLVAGDYVSAQNRCSEWDPIIR